MKNGKIIGMTMFVCGLILLIGYSLYQGFQNITTENIDIIIAISTIVIILGLVILFASILMEQQKDKKKMKDEIKKEDLEPWLSQILIF